MSDQEVEIVDDVQGSGDEQEDPYAVLESFATRLGSGRDAKWQCKKCKWQRRGAPLKVLAHLSSTKGYDVPACKGKFSNAERQALSAAMKARTAANKAAKKDAQRSREHTAMLVRDEDAERSPQHRRSPRIAAAAGRDAGAGPSTSGRGSGRSYLTARETGRLAKPGGRRQLSFKEASKDHLHRDARDALAMAFYANGWAFNGVRDPFV